MDQKLEKLIKRYLKNKPGMVAAYIFGSFAMSQELDNSDIEVAVLLKKGKLHFTEKNRMELELIKQTNRVIDLVVMNDVSSILQMQILRKGKLIFCDNEKLLSQFQVQAVKTYLDLKRIRKPIEDQLINVSIYG